MLLQLVDLNLKCQYRTEQNIYFIDLNSTVSGHTYFDITKDSYKVTINVYMDLTTKL